MNKHTQGAVRLTQLIRDQLIAQEQQQGASVARSHQQLSQLMQQFQNLQQKTRKAQGRGWFLAARQLQMQAGQVLQDLRAQIDTAMHLHQQHEPIASLHDLVHDLQQLENEFEGYEFDPKARILSVQTDCIELEGVELGPFQINLPLRSLDQAHPAFSVVALDPHPASGRDGITHPHVSDEQLCVGDAVGSIRAALQTGRICDFFLIVRSVLQTYNRHSAYVSLEEWEGQPCHDCGHIISEGNAFYCESCEHDYCDSCFSNCRRCDTSACLGCLRECPQCNQPCCGECLSTCSECDAECCVECLTEGLCPDCRDKKEERHEEAQSEPVAASQQPA